jgi:hypothetical protein
LTEEGAGLPFQAAKLTARKDGHYITNLEASVKAWDADLTPEERARAIAEEVERTEQAQGTAELPHSWTDPRTANLQGNYVTN